MPPLSPNPSPAEDLLDLVETAREISKRKPTNSLTVRMAWAEALGLPVKGHDTTRRITQGILSVHEKIDWVDGYLKRRTTPDAAEAVARDLRSLAPLDNLAATWRPTKIATALTGLRLTVGLIHRERFPLLIGDIDSLKKDAENLKARVQSSDLLPDVQATLTRYLDAFRRGLDAYPKAGVAVFEDELSVTALPGDAEVLQRHRDRPEVKETGRFWLGVARTSYLLHIWAALFGPVYQLPGPDENELIENGPFYEIVEGESEERPSDGLPPPPHGHMLPAGGTPERRAEPNPSEPEADLPENH